MMDMPPVAEEIARVRSLAALTAAAREWPAEQLEAAERLADDLGLLAELVVEADGTIADCTEPGCPLDEHPAGAGARRLAETLATAHRERAEHVEPVRPTTPREILLTHRRYVQALRDAAAVVYCCRRVLHTSGRCFFDREGTASGLCGRVLMVAHQVEHDLLIAG
jgi:hypothetical protein